MSGPAVAMLWGLRQLEIGKSEGRWKRNYLGCKKQLSRDRVNPLPCGLLNRKYLLVTILVKMRSLFSMAQLEYLTIFWRVVVSVNN